MKTYAVVLFLGFSLSLSFALSHSSGQDAGAKPDAGESKTDAPNPVGAKGSDELIAIRQASESFVAAFNKGDAKAVAEHWTEDGELVDESGRRLTGRAAIQKEYEAFFAAHPGHRLRLTIDAVKLLSDSAAIEDGHTTLDPAPIGPPAISRYTAVHVKTNGRWMMSTVRETREETPSQYRRLEDLSWMVGTWTAEEHGARTEVRVRWVSNKSFLEREYAVTDPAGHTVSSGLQVIGWSVENERLQSWTFASDGSYAIGVWTPREGGWAIESRGTLPDGSTTSAVTILTRLDDAAISWRSIERRRGGAAMPDTDEIVLKRIVPSR